MMGTFTDIDTYICWYECGDALFQYSNISVTRDHGAFGRVQSSLSAGADQITHVCARSFSFLGVI